jgi:hypothetical protein
MPVEPSLGPSSGTLLPPALLDTVVPACLTPLAKHRPDYRKRRRAFKNREAGITTISVSWIVIAYHLWVKMRQPARVRLYYERGDLIIIPGDDIQLENHVSGVAIGLRDRKWLVSLLQTGEYPNARTTEWGGDTPAVRVPGCTWLKNTPLEPAEVVQARERRFANAIKLKRNIFT